MNMKKTWKRFFSLDRRHAEGFTLVELIVVIAILAILGGVAVPAYSGYVEKANKQADISLISEIEHALTLAMYSTPFTENPSGILVVSKDGITLNGSAIAEGSEMDIALRNAFGGSLDALKLKYDGWNASHLNTLNSDVAKGIKESSYLSGERYDQLLTDVEKFTTMANNLANSLDSSISTDVSLAELYGKDLLDATASKYGIDGPEDGDWDAWHEENPQEFSNLLVLATAYDTNTNIMNGNAGSTATGLVTGFSKYYAFAATCPEFSDVLTQYMDAMNSEEATVINGVTVNPVTNAAEGGQWLTNLQNEIAKEQYKNAAGQTFTDYTTKIIDEDQGITAADRDYGAFAYIMSALNSTPVEDVASDLGNNTLFTDGAVKNMYDQYMSAVEAMHGTAGLNFNINDGEVAVIFDQTTMNVMNTIS